MCRVEVKMRRAVSLLVLTEPSPPTWLSSRKAALRGTGMCRVEVKMPRAVSPWVQSEAIGLFAVFSQRKPHLAIFTKPQ
jgi:hypothetical protein